MAVKISRRSTISGLTALAATSSLHASVKEIALSPRFQAKDGTWFALEHLVLVAIEKLRSRCSVVNMSPSAAAFLSIYAPSFVYTFLKPFTLPENLSLECSTTTQVVEKDFNSTLPNTLKVALSIYSGQEGSARSCLFHHWYSIDLDTLEWDECRVDPAKETD